MALDWTEEAIRFFRVGCDECSQGRGVDEKRPYLEAIPFFDRLTSRGAQRNCGAVDLQKNDGSTLG